MLGLTGRNREWKWIERQHSDRLADIGDSLELCPVASKQFTSSLHLELDLRQTNARDAIVTSADDRFAFWVKMRLRSLPLDGP